jgi:hypothetical protein
MADFLEPLMGVLKGKKRRWKDMADTTHAPVVYVGNAADIGGGGALTDTELRADPVPVSLTELPDITTVPLYATLQAVVAVAADATGAIVAANATHKIRVIQYTIIGHGAGSFEWKSATTAKSGAMDYVAASGASPYCPEGLIETAVNEALNLTTVTGAANGHISYQLV